MKITTIFLEEVASKSEKFLENVKKFTDWYFSYRRNLTGPSLLHGGFTVLL
jgi:hypothetical protein